MLKTMTHGVLVSHERSIVLTAATHTLLPRFENQSLERYGHGYCHSLLCCIQVLEASLPYMYFMSGA